MDTSIPWKRNQTYWNTLRYEYFDVCSFCAAGIKDKLAL